MSFSQDFQRMAGGFGRTLAHVEFWRPDHPWLLQDFIWQFDDLFPEFPRLNKFLDDWRENNKQARIQFVTVAHTKLIKPTEFRHVSDEFRLH